MSGYKKTGEITLTCVESVEAYRRVILKDDPKNLLGKGLGVAAEDTVGIGSALYEGEHNDSIATRLTNAQGTHIGIAHGTITTGTELFAATNGTVSASGTVALGAFALSDAEDEGFVEYMYS